MGKSIIKQDVTPKSRQRIGNKTSLKKLIWRNLKFADALVQDGEAAIDDSMRMKALAVLPQMAGTYLRILESEQGVTEGRVIVVQTNLHSNEPPTLETPF